MKIWSDVVEKDRHIRQQCKERAIKNIKDIKNVKDIVKYPEYRSDWIFFWYQLIQVVLDIGVVFFYPYFDFSVWYYFRDWLACNMLKLLTLSCHWRFCQQLFEHVINTIFNNWFGYFVWQVHHSFANSLIESSDEASCSSAGDQSDEDSDSSAGNPVVRICRTCSHSVVHCHYMHQCFTDVSLWMLTYVGIILHISINVILNSSFCVCFWRQETHVTSAEPVKVSSLWPANYWQVPVAQGPQVLLTSVSAKVQQ